MTEFVWPIILILNAVLVLLLGVFVMWKIHRDKKSGYPTKDEVNKPVLPRGIISIEIERTETEQKAQTNPLRAKTTIDKGIAQENDKYPIGSSKKINIPRIKDTLIAVDVSFMLS